MVNFKNTIVVLTSNIGSTRLLEAPQMNEGVKREILDEVKRYFRPELLNRIDEIIVFNRLTDDDLKKIVDLELERLQRKLEARHIELRVGEGARARLAREGYDPVFGARPLRRLLQRKIQDPLALKLLNGEIQEGNTVTFDGDSRLAVVGRS